MTDLKPVIKDDWDSFSPEREQQTLNLDAEEHSLSLSMNLKKILSQPAISDLVKPGKILEINLPEYESIYEIASAHGLTVQEWVQCDPHQALRQAEIVCSKWDNLITTAAITGCIPLPDESTGEIKNYAVNKNQTKLLEVRANMAHKQLDAVNECIIMLIDSEDKRHDALEKAMYRRALRGDTRLAIYLHDRIDGRPAETKQLAVSYDNTYEVYAIIKTLFDKQLEVLNSGSGVRLICCSRRAGKTHFLVGYMLIECLRKPRTTVMYIGETMELSEALVDKAVQDIIDLTGLKNKKGLRFDWRHMDNGSQIIVRGLSNTKDPDQIRGKAAKVIVIDEFFHLKSELLEYMQREVLEPMQMDYADDYTFLCAGTPPPIKGTYGEKVWNTWDVPHFTWTWRDNPHPVSVEARKEFVEKVLHDKGLDWSSSFARREYNGEWAYDDDLLLYPDFHTYDKNEAMPNIRASRIIFGIDYGVGDNDAIWGAVWNDDEKRGYQFWETKFNRLDIMNLSISQLEYLGEQVLRAWREALDYFPDLEPKEANKRILWEADDSDQHITDYFNNKLRLEGERYEDLRLNIANAHKTDKSLMFDKLRDCLRRGDILIMRGSKTEHELVSTILLRGPNGEIYKEVDNKAFHPDLLPPMRYAMWNVIGF